MSRRSRQLSLILFVALSLRSLALFSPWNVERLFVDEVEYATYARNLATRGVFEAPWIAGPDLKAHRTPVFPGFLALNHLMAGERGFVLSSKRLNVLVGSCVPVLVFLCVELLIGVDTSRKRRAAFVCGVLSAGYPYLILFGLLIMSDLLFTVLALLMSYLLLWLAKHPVTMLALVGTGLVGGLATLTRPGFALFPLVACVLLYFRLAAGNAPGKRAAWVAVIMAAYAVTLSPWLVRNYMEFGRFPVLSTNGAEPLWIGNHPESRGYLLSPASTEAEQRDWNHALETPNELERDERFRDMALQYVREDPVKYLMLSFAKAAYLWNVETAEIRLLTAVGRFEPVGPAGQAMATILLSAPFPLLTLVFLGALFFGRPADGRYLLIGFIAYSTFLSMVFFGASRFHLPFVPQLIICSSQLFLVRKTEFQNPKKLAGFATVAVLYLTALVTYRVP